MKPSIVVGHLQGEDYSTIKGFGITKDISGVREGYGNINFMK